ncbi:MAG: nucleotidyltransferase, partial [Clostridia bacterium]|nr:nucleotidyltransferase [Clostridia bacterium]
VMQCTDKWYGVTYKADKPDVERAIAGFIKEGLYPENLWD